MKVRRRRRYYIGCGS